MVIIINVEPTGYSRLVGLYNVIDDLQKTWIICWKITLQEIEEKLASYDCSISVMKKRKPQGTKAIYRAQVSKSRRTI